MRKHPHELEILLDLKDQGHRLLDQYKDITGCNSEKAYTALKARMKGKAFHFSSMNDEQTLKLAIGNLKKLIAHAQYEIRR